MFQRPKVGETEEDLLKQEEEFLKKSGKSSTRKRTYEVGPNKVKTYKVAGVIGDIVEKNESLGPQSFEVLAKGKGFPALFQIDPNITANRKGKKSLFALHMEKNKNNMKDSNIVVQNAPEVSALEIKADDGECVMECEDSVNISDEREKCAVTRDIKESICKESLEKLSKMSEKEILEAQRKLYETLDPKLISLLKSRGKAKEKNEAKKIEEVPSDVEMKESYNEGEEDEVIEKVSSYVGERWINMDFIEKEKLEWVGDIPDSKSLEPDQPYSARFDFKGELQPFNMERVDVTKSLHHHGDEPERPGYTVQELYQLSRSTVLQQRILALNTLANIIRKTKLGYYDVCFDGFLLHKLLESDLFLLLRFSIDENSLIPAAINCLRRLLYNDTDEYCLDKLLGITENDVQPLLFDKMETNEEEEKELKDNTIINCDVIKGVLRTDLIVRITYILNNLSSDRETITNAILCFIRISRHSVESSSQILAKSDLLSFIYSCVNCNKPIYQGIKLFRLLVDQSKEFASEIATKYPMNFLISFINSESMTEIPKAEFYLLKIESLYLWRNLLKHDFMVDEFTSWTPCFIRLLRFYIEKVDLCGEGDFDFELFSAMLSLLKLCVRKKIEIDTNYVAIMYICLEKWLKQLMQFKKFNYAGLKALGSCFAFFVDYFKVFEIDQTSLRFIQNLNSIISSLIKSPVFDSMSANLIHYSHILVAKTVKRDPSNLPSLCSVYEGGYDYLRIVNNQSSLPFFMPFVKYLKCSYSVSHDCRNSIELLVHCCNIRKYIEKVNKLKNNPDNWFTKYELSLLTDFHSLLYIVKDEDTVKLGFRLLPMFRVDDDCSKSVLSIITDKKVLMSRDECFDNMFKLYSDHVFTSVSYSDSVVPYRNQLVGEDWMYKIFTLLRGKEEVDVVAKALKFISFTLGNNSALLERVPYNIRYYHLCTVFLTDSNVFDDEIQKELKVNFNCIVSNRDKVQLDKKVDKNKSFYDLYTELITQYAGVSYGLHIFAEFVLFPLQNKFDVSFRKLLWFEYLHVLRVITLPYPAQDFIELKDFIEPCETDESLLVTYLNAVSNSVIVKNRNPFVYSIAVFNVRNYLQTNSADHKLTSFLKQKIAGIKNERVKQDLAI